VTYTEFVSRVRLLDQSTAFGSGARNTGCGTSTRRRRCRSPAAATSMTATLSDCWLATSIRRSWVTEKNHGHRPPLGNHGRSLTSPLVVQVGDHDRVVATVGGVHVPAVCADL